MKKTLILFAAVLMTVVISAQAPDKMSYQAVIRDASGNLITEQEIGIQISILQGTSDGTIVYTETQTPLTNKNGLISIKIGGEAGFADIDWSAGPYFIKTETDPSGGTDYTITGTSQLLSVPYALHSGTSDVLTGEITESQISDLQTYYLASNPEGFITAYIVTEEDVTAHESALSISESQITDLQNYLLDITGKEIDDLSNVDLTGLAAGNILKYDETEEKWVVTDPSDLETDPVFTAWDKDYEDLTNKPNLTIFATTTDMNTALDEKVDKETGKNLQAEGTQVGEMQYWNGAEWITVERGSTGQVLTFVNGKPIWGAIPSAEAGEVQNPTTGAIWMDKNLGATQVATSSTDADAYGDLYQWGRAADGHQIRTSGTTATNATTAVPNGGNSWDGLFITEGSYPYDWLTPQDDNLWQGVSGTNNPCPSGYRLPTEAEWEAERTSWGNNNSAGAFGSPLKLPVAGIRLDSAGSLDYVGSSANYWSSTVAGALSRLLVFSSSVAYMSSNYRAYGDSVRCLKD